MKTYFLVYTGDNEYSSSIKYITETKEQAEKFLLADNSGWYSPKGSGNIEEVDCRMTRLREWTYFAGKCIEYFDYKTKEWKYLDRKDNQWKNHR